MQAGTDLQRKPDAKVSHNTRTKHIESAYRKDGGYWHGEGQMVNQAPATNFSENVSLREM